MATVRTVLAEALRALRTVAIGEDPVADELAVGLEAAQNLILDIHEGRGPMLNVDVTAATVVPAENQRLRIQNGDTASVTLPNSVPVYATYNPYDYGFTASPAAAAVGSTAVADGYTSRAPYDGTRIEIVGTTQALYFYRDDINAWQLASGLTIDSELPFNARLTSAFASLLAERLLDVLSTAQPTPLLMRRIARGRVAMFSQTGKARTETVGQYL